MREEEGKGRPRKPELDIQSPVDKLLKRWFQVGGGRGESRESVSSE